MPEAVPAIILLGVVLCASLSGVALGSLGYTTNVEPIVKAFRLDMHPRAAIASQTELVSRVANGTVDSFISLHGRHPTLAGAWTDIPLALSAVCVAHSVPSQDLLTSTAALGALMLGTAADGVFRSVDNAITRSTAELTLVLSTESSAMSTVLAALVRDGVAGFSSGTTVPVAVATNPRIQWVPSDAAVAAAIKGNANTVGFLPMPQCGSLARADLMVARPGGGKALVSADLNTDAATQYAVKSGVVVPSPFASLYPLVGPVFLHVKHTPAAECPAQDGGTRTAWEAVLTRFLKSQPFENAYRHSSTVSLSKELKMGSVSAGFAAMNCTSATVVNGRGSSAVWSVMTAWAEEYAFAKDVYVAYDPTGSGGGTRGLKAREVPFAMSDSLFDAQERAQFPTIKFVPAVGFAVSVVANVPGKTINVVLPVCALVQIMTGAITHWDDPAIRVADDPLELPHVPIRIVARSGRSGTIEVFTRGLAREDQYCNGGAQTVQVSNTWQLKADSMQASTTAALAEVVSTPYSMTIVSKTTARDLSLPEVTLRFNNGAEASTDNSFVEAAMESSTYDPITNTVDFEHVDGHYPFIGVTYFVYHSVNDDADCTDLKRSLDFMQWSLADNAATLRTAHVGSVPTPKRIVRAELGNIRSVTCRGERMYPADNSSGSGLATWVIVVVCVVAVAAAIAVGSSVGLVTKGGARDIKNAPTSGQVTLLFTDIQDSTKLWSNCPASMSAALEEHHRIIREAIARHKAYEVKTVGDSFMIACGSVRNAVQLAIDVQEGLQATLLPAAIAECYACDDTFIEVDDDPDRLAALDPVWNGLRVRIGIHVGQPDCHLDAVTKGYDYYGNDVNIAARVEAATRGGQILCTKAVAEAVAKDFSMQDMGEVSLKGVAKPTAIFNVACPNIAGRVFNMYSTVTQLNGDAPFDVGMSSEWSETSSAADWSEGTSTPTQRDSVTGAAAPRKSTIRTTDDEIHRLPLVRDGTVSFDAASAHHAQLIVHYESLFRVLRPERRQKMLDELGRSWRVKENSCAALAMKVLPQAIVKLQSRDALGPRGSRVDPGVLMADPDCEGRTGSRGRSHSEPLEN